LFLANYKINVSIIFLFLFLFMVNASDAIPVPRSMNPSIMVIIPCKRNTSKFLLFHSNRILSWIGSLWNVHIQTSSCFLTLFPSERVQAVSSCFRINTSALFHISFKTSTQIGLGFLWRSGPVTCFLYIPTPYPLSYYRRTWHIHVFWFSFQNKTIRPIFGLFECKFIQLVFHLILMNILICFLFLLWEVLLNCYHFHVR